MAKKNHRIKFTQRVTTLHGAIFAHCLGTEVRECGYCACGALTATAIMEWPKEGKGDTPEKERFMALENEIIERTFQIAQNAIGAAFVVAATEVLERERHRQKKRRDRKS